MKPVTADMLRAHLMVASLTAMGAEVFALLALLVLPASQQDFSSTPFRLIAVAVIIGGVIVMRQFAHSAFELAIQSRHATSHGLLSWPVQVAPDCPRRALVILHLRLTGRPFVLAKY